MYYLQSRYYNPDWGRFINPDSSFMLNSSGKLLNNNLFAYCTNDPINYNDKLGFSKTRDSQGLNDWWLQGKDADALEKMYNNEKDPAKRQKIKTQQKYIGARDKRKRENNNKKMEIGVLTLGSGYIIYRAIRIIPSLAPPLWWTIPANVLCF